MALIPEWSSERFSGYAHLIGRLTGGMDDRQINLANHSLYSVLLLAFYLFFAFTFTDTVKGNSYPPHAGLYAGLVVTS